jgi:hypothetical protein
MSGTTRLAAGSGPTDPLAGATGDAGLTSLTESDL